jgi:hypothetical protein
MFETTQAYDDLKAASSVFLGASDLPRALWNDETFLMTSFVWDSFPCFLRIGLDYEDGWLMRHYGLVYMPTKASQIPFPSE